MADPTEGEKNPTKHSRQQWTAPGVISVNELYRLEEAKARLGWTDSAMRQARRRGLKLLHSGKRRYLTGKEILRFLEAESEARET